MGVKTDYRGIVILELFPHCNFNCSFCYQNAEDRTSYFNENEKSLFIQHCTIRDNGNIVQR